MDEQAVAWLRQQIEGDRDRWQQQAAYFRHRHELMHPGSTATEPIGDAADAYDRVADCEAKLRLLDEHRWVTEDDPDYSVTPGLEGCAICHYHSQMYVRGLGYPCWTLRMLATAYQHRPRFAEFFRADGLPPGKTLSEPPA